MSRHPALLAAAAYFVLAQFAPTAVAARPADALDPFEGGAEPLVAPKSYSNFRLHLDYALPEGEAALQIGEGLSVPLKPGAHREVEVAYEQTESGGAYARVWEAGKLVQDGAVAGAASQHGLALSAKESRERFNFGEDFTLVVRFATTDGGTLAAMAPPEGKWQANSKALFLKGGRLTFDIGWVGAVSGGPKLNDGKPHTAAIVVRGGEAALYADGKAVGRRGGFAHPDNAGDVFKIGAASPNFGGDFQGGRIDWVRGYARALDSREVAVLSEGGGKAANTPDYEWQPSGAAAPRAEGFGIPGIPADIRIDAGAGFRLNEAWIQPLGDADHAALIAASDGEAFERGKAIFNTLCVTCHGTPEKEGTLPTALRFHSQPFKNGSDPFRMYQTLVKGFNQMVPQPQYNARQKYDVIHYIREAFVKPHNPTQYAAADAAYLAALPKKMQTLQEEAPREERLPQYKLMDFGPSLFWTYQVEEGNIAYKGIAVRLDPGPGGVSKGRAWMLYDHDTLRAAAAWSGEGFVDWRGIAFDGSHGTHTSIAGKKAFANPVGPGWASPEGGWEDPRLRGRDDKPYGPLPREWAQYKGFYQHGDRAVLRYTVGGAEVLESPGLIEYGAVPIFTAR
ncbi:MAG: DUF6797 domain-containing protein [Verrucomicrobiales bacterium]